MMDVSRRFFLKAVTISAAAAGLRILPVKLPDDVPIGCDQCGAHVFTLRNFVSYRRGVALCTACNGYPVVSHWIVVTAGDTPVMSSKPGAAVVFDFGFDEQTNLLVTSNLIRGNRPVTLWSNLGV